MQNKQTFDIHCDCGQVGIRVEGAPAARAYCHCRACQQFYGLPVLSANAWPSEALSIVKGHALLCTHQHPHLQMRRHYCITCGQTLYGSNRLDMAVIRTSLIADAHGGDLPAEHAPTLHIFYAHRALDINDALPKYSEGWDGPLHQAGTPTIQTSAV